MLGAFQAGRASSIGLFYAVALPLLTLAHIEGMPIGIAYGVWATSGVALTAIGARILFRDPLTRLTTIGIGLIGIGVILIDMRTPRTRPAGSRSPASWRHQSRDSQRPATATQSAALNHSTKPAASVSWARSSAVRNRDGSFDQTVPLSAGTAVA